MSAKSSHVVFNGTNISSDDSNNVIANAIHTETQTSLSEVAVDGAIAV
jgi:hypothetical protein